MIRITGVNNLVAWMSSRSNYNVCLRLVGYDSRLELRPINFYCMSNFIIKVANNFLLIVIIEILELLIVIVEVIS